MKLRDYEYADWDEESLTDKIVSDLGDLNGLNRVEWASQGPSEEFRELIRIETRQGTVIRLGITYVEDEDDIQEAFDESLRNHFVDRAFEELGCSCVPYRHRLEELETKYDTEVQRFRLNLANSGLAREIKDLRKEIAEIDRQEHPALDATAREAARFLSVWLEDQVKDGNQEILGLGNRELALLYARAWNTGWRPQS